MSEMAPEYVVPDTNEVQDRVVVPLWPERLGPKVISEKVDISALYDRWSEAIESQRQAQGPYFTGGASFD